MNIQLPNLDINIDEGLDNKEILQQILDAIHKQRKELNFYLMNLNEDNMPTIAGRMEDIEGNISLIDQKIDEILLLVANNAGDIAALSVRADQIQAQVADNAGNISSLSLRADEIAGRVADAENNISQLSIRADEIETVVVDNHEYVTTQLVLLGDEIVEVETTLSNQISTVSQTASQIQTQVSNLVTEVSNLGTTVTENYSTLTQRADRIESNVSSISTDVSSLDRRVSSHSSEISQLSNRISSKVSYTDYNGVEIVSLINQDAYRVSIDARAIDLTGITTIYSSNGRYYTEMYGSDLNINVGRERFGIGYNGIVGWDIYTNGEPIRFYRAGIYFETDVYFDGYVDFSNAYVYGLDTDIDTRYLIECYYASNKCYIDYGGSSRLTIRDRYGDVVGHISFD